jgi:hypothetical protein
MSGSRIRKIAATCVALVLCGAVLSQAAGPREFLSGIWKKRPRVSETRMNPKKWFKKDRQEEAKPLDSTGRVKRDALSSIRQSLNNDPFRAGDPTRLQRLVTDSPTENHQRPAAVQPNRQLELDPSPLTNSQSPSPRRTADRSESRLQESFDSVLEARSARSSVAKQRPSEVEEREYSPAFEAMVQQLIADRKAGASPRRDRPIPNATLPPSVFDRADNGNAELVQESQRQAANNRRSAPQFESLELDNLGLAAQAPAPSMQINPGPLPGQNTNRSRVNQFTTTDRNRSNEYPVENEKQPQFANEWSQESVNELVNRSRREMQTGISEPDPRPNLQTVGRSNQQENNDNRLRLLGQDPPLVLSPQLPQEDHQYVNQRKRGQFQVAQDPPLDRTTNSRNQSSERSRNQSPTNDYKPMIITPRVMSNQAPKLSIPNNNQYRRLSYEESASNKQGIKQPAQEKQQPMMIPHAGQREAVRPDVRKTEAQNELAENALLASESPKAITMAPVNWDDAADIVAPTSASLPWLMMATIAASTAAIISFFIVRTRKVVMVASEPSNAASEAD